MTAKVGRRLVYQEWVWLPWVVGVALVGAFLSRSVWLSESSFHPDESTVLWMALDAVRELRIPDHGLVSSHEAAFQPPGLVWVTMPFVAVGGGRPEVVIVGFAMLNAAAIAALVATVARLCGLAYAVALGTFLIVGPDAYFSPAIWHPSLYTGAVALMMTAGFRLRRGSTWWAGVLVAVPGLYALVHYSGLVLWAPALGLLVLSRRDWRHLWRATAGAAALVMCAWGPFLSFEAGRNWVDLTRIMGATDSASTVGAKVEDRFSGLGYAVSHLGQSLHDSVRLTPVLWTLVVVALLIAVSRRRWRDLGFALPAVVLGVGVAAQAVVDQGERTDVLMLWLVPLYALSAWAIAEIASLARLVVPRRPTASVVVALVAVLVAIVGGFDLVRSIDDVPASQRLSEQWRAARAGEPVHYEAGVNPEASHNRFYLPCDPPYDWGSETWYLREVLDPGAGLEAAAEAGAFRSRPGPPCASR